MCVGVITRRTIGVTVIEGLRAIMASPGDETGFADSDGETSACG
jgi:hypothetical protein